MLTIKTAKLTPYTWYKSTILTCIMKNFIQIFYQSKELIDQLFNNLSNN